MCCAVQAAVVADQNAKLSIFCTRPAIYSPIFNFIVELLGTVALIFGAFMMDEQVKMMPKEFRTIASNLTALYIGELTQNHHCRSDPITNLLLS